VAANQELAAKLGSAWAHHRRGGHDDAITEFRNILKESPDNQDALYGLALAQRAVGQSNEAISSLRTALEHVSRSLDEHPGEDRFEMLTRMLKQRIAEIEAGAKSAR
jgi:tetratricopeptide (TPR) repeat protein